MMGCLPGKNQKETNEINNTNDLINYFLLPENYNDLSKSFIKEDKYRSFLQSTIISIQKNKPVPRALKDDNSIFQEYEILQKITDDDFSHLKALTKETENCRYSDVKSYVHNTVELLGNEKKYFNGSWIHIPEYKFFIATQGPLPSTSEDFWKVCFDNDVKIIIMLCSTIEKGSKKCDEYWKAKLRHYKLQCSERNISNCLIERNIKISNGINEKTIIQLQFTGWPDHGAPDVYSAYDSFMYMIQYIYENKGNSPVVVHCSAGVGRTGTFITLYNLFIEIISQLNDTNTNYISFSVFGIVRKLKEFRILMVQTDIQYKFIFEFVNLLLHKLLEKK